MQDSSGETAMDLAVKNRSEECIRIINEEKGEFVMDSL